MYRVYTRFVGYSCRRRRRRCGFDETEATAESVKIVVVTG